MLTFYTTPGRESAEIIGKAFCAGCGGNYVESRLLQAGDAAFYGLSKFTLPVFRAAKGWYYIDNGYFRPGHYDGYYKVTKNAAQHTGEGDSPPDRWETLDLKIKPWRKTGRHVLVVLQSKTYHELRGRRPGTWLWDTLAEINRVTDRPIIVRPKPTARTKKRPFEQDLADAWCMVTYSSNTAVEALIEGVPVFVTEGAAKSMSGDLSDIETPYYPEREQWAWNLAANQWTLEEMKSGQCWREI